MKVKVLKFVPQQTIDDLLMTLGRGTQAKLAHHFSLHVTTVGKLLKNPDAFIGTAAAAQDWRARFVQRMREMIEIEQARKDGYDSYEKGTVCPFPDGSACAIAWNEGIDIAAKHAELYDKEAYEHG